MVTGDIVPLEPLSGKSAGKNIDDIIRFSSKGVATATPPDKNTARYLAL